MGKVKIESLCDKYISELRTLKFYSPQQVLVVNGGSTASIAKLRGRIVQQLRLCYTLRTEQLSSVFRGYVETKRTLPLEPTLRNPVHRHAAAAAPAAGDAGSPAAWSIIKLWRYGYDLAMHYLRYGQCRAAAGVFQRLFLEYFNNSDDYSFVTRRQTLDRLGRDTTLLQPSAGGREGYHLVSRDGSPESQTAAPGTPAGSASQRAGAAPAVRASSAYPRELALGAEILDGLLLIVAGEMTTYLLMNREDLARERFQSFVQVTKEKFEDVNQWQDKGGPLPPPMEHISVAHQHFFLLQCYLSAMRLLWPSYRITRQRTAADHPRAPTGGGEGALLETGSGTTQNGSAENSSFANNNSLFLTDNNSFARSAVVPFGGPDASQQYSLISPSGAHAAGVGHLRRGREDRRGGQPRRRRVAGRGDDHDGRLAARAGRGGQDGRPRAVQHGEHQRGRAAPDAARRRQPHRG
ncbi:hypothetical protein STCU_11584 [Strigomonas culicis]|uniref:Uncharacterized protein n=1 Tax=Strigomonas culicis TaxID=28005 RepID=S9TGL4_9TRYP|nr:hypothetical protein STCU_11584 [Strigomonas culicis]|eukprot:EPY16049.1 hypothetical protein STCU_11584 [Strigomonas culicis]